MEVTIKKYTVDDSGSIEFEIIATGADAKWVIEAINMATKGLRSTNNKERKNESD